MCMHACLCSSGLGALELWTTGLKSMGAMLSRQISLKGVTYAIVQADPEVKMR